MSCGHPYIPESYNNTLVQSCPRFRTASCKLTSHLVYPWWSFPCAEVLTEWLQFSFKHIMLGTHYLLARGREIKSPWSPKWSSLTAFYLQHMQNNLTGLESVRRPAGWFKKLTSLLHFSRSQEEHASTNLQQRKWSISAQCIMSLLWITFQRLLHIKQVGQLVLISLPICLTRSSSADIEPL